MTYLKHVLQAIALLGVVLSTLPVRANIFERDNRVDVRPRPTPLGSVGPAELQAVGMLRSIPDDGLPGTAFLVGECHIVTAFHVAFPNSEKPGFVPSSKVKSTFYVGRTEGSRLSYTGYRAQATATPIEWGNYLEKTPLGKKTWGAYLGDWAILKLDDCLGRSFGFVNFAVPFRASDERSLIVNVAGFPQDRMRAPGITFEKNCHIRSQGPGFLNGVDCAITVGASGGPVFEERDGIYYVVGVVTQMYQPDDGVLPHYKNERRNEIILIEQFIGSLRRHTS